MRCELAALTCLTRATCRLACLTFAALRVGLAAVAVGAAATAPVLAGGLAVCVPCASTGAVNTLAARSATANFLNMGYSFSGSRARHAKPGRTIDRLTADLGATVRRPR